MKRIIHILMPLLIYTVSGAQPLRSGLKFSGNKDIQTWEQIPYLQRTSLDYSPHGSLILPQDFKLSFDFAVWKINFFGYLFFMENKEQQRFVISFYHYGDKKHAYLKFSTNKNGVIYKLPFLKSKLNENTWNSVTVRYRRTKNQLTILKNGITDTTITVSLPDLSDCKMVSGYSRFSYDVPGMILKDVIVSSINGEKLFYWPLDQSGGEAVRELVNHSDALQKNGLWMRAFHYKWQESIVLPEIPNSKEVFFSNYDHSGDCLYGFSQKRKYRYNIQTGTMDSVKIGPYDKKQEVLWILGANNGINYLWRLNLSDFNWRRYAAALPGNIQLFFLAHNKIYVLNAKKPNDRFYYYTMSTLFYPPITKEQYENYLYYPTDKYKTWLIFTIPSFFAYFFFIIFYRKRTLKKKKQMNTPYIALKENVKEEEERVYIHLLNEFTVRKNGIELANEKLLPKNRELLIYLLLHYAEDAQQLIEVRKLTEDIWPYLTKDKAKNARTSSLSRLRVHLKEIPELHIQSGRPGWRIYCDIPLSVDYAQSLMLIKNDADSIDEIITILQKGALLPNDKYKWLEKYKTRYKNAVIAKALNVLKTKIGVPAEKIELLAENILQWEPLNETALRYLLNAFIAQKRFGRAKERFDIFNKRYKDIFGEIYSADMNFFIK